MADPVDFQINNLFQGVSTQPSQYVLEGQLRDIVNASLTVNEGGLSRRPGTWHFAKLTDTPISTAPLVTNSWGDIITLGESGFIILDAEGHEQTVTYDADQSYLDGTTLPPEERYRMVVVGSRVYVLNKEVTPRKAAAPDPGTSVPVSSCVIEIRTADPEYGKFTLDLFWPGQVESYSIDSAMTPLIAATELANKINASSNYVAYQLGTWIVVQRASGAQFYAQLESFLGEGSHNLWGSSVNDASELPNRAADGSHIAVRANNTSPQVWYKFQANLVGSKIDEGTWVPVPSWTETNAWRNETLPHYLEKTLSGWYFRSADWASRPFGDDQVIPFPEFINTPISDIAVFSDRFVIATGPNVYFSEQGNFHNFWPTQISQVIATDSFGRTLDTPTDVVFMQPYRKALFVSSQDAQFEIGSGEQGFAPQTVVADKTTSIGPVTDVVASGTQLLIATGQRGRTGPNRSVEVFSYQYSEDALTTTETPIATHVKGYLPTLIRSAAATSLGIQLFGDGKGVYVLNTYSTAQEAVQTAWSRWVFDGDVVNFTVSGTEAYFIVQSGADCHMVRMDLDNPATSGLKYNLSMDSAVLYDITEADVTVSPLGDRTTTLTLPDAVAQTEDLDSIGVIVTGDTVTSGIRLPAVSQAEGQLTFTGDWSGLTVVIGKVFETYGDLEDVYPRTEQFSAPAGTLFIQSIEATLDRTILARVVVSVEQRPPRVKSFTSRNLTSLNKPPTPKSGRIKASVRSRSERATIRFECDSPYPAKLLSLRVKGYWRR